MSLVKLKRCELKSYHHFSVLLALIAIAAVVSWGFSRDSQNYIDIFNLYGASPWGALGEEALHHETFFIVASKVIYKLGLGSFFLFLLYAAISVSIKYHLIRAHSKDMLISLAFFSAYFFILLDSTQIRFGMAVSFLYLGLHYLSLDRKITFAMIVLASTVLFHVLSIAFIILLVLKDQRSTYWLIGMVVLSILLYPFDLRVLVLDVLRFVIEHLEIYGTFINKLYGYISKPSSDISLGIFYKKALLVYFCAFVIFRYRNSFTEYESLCYRALLLSIFFFILLNDIVDLQVRLSDLFGFALVFIVPYIHKWLAEYTGERPAYALLLVFFAAFLAKFAFYDKMVLL